MQDHDLNLEGPVGTRAREPSSGLGSQSCKRARQTPSPSYRSNGIEDSRFVRKASYLLVDWAAKSSFCANVPAFICAKTFAGAVLFWFWFCGG